MSALADAAASYLHIRRALGYRLERYGRLLTEFVVYLDERDLTTITTDAALGWACQPADAGPGRWSRRLGVVRGFAVYMVAIDPATQVPPTGLWPARRRPEPFVCTPSQIAALVDAAGSIASPAASTYKTVIALLAVTGMRVGEALGLNDDDVDLDAGVLTVHSTKFGKSREVMLHPTATAALTGYITVRDERFGQRADSALFLSVNGRRLRDSVLWTNWRRAIDRAGIIVDGRRPRRHDLRHSFAVNTLRAWHEAGVDVQARLPLLSTYLGHLNPASTYWYLSATPDLLTAAARRLESHAGAVS
jgi:integrase/recombinase XerD